MALCCRVILEMRAPSEALYSLSGLCEQNKRVEQASSHAVLSMGKCMRVLVVCFIDRFVSAYWLPIK